MEFKKKVTPAAEPKPDMPLPNLRAKQNYEHCERLAAAPPGNHAKLLRFAKVTRGPYELKYYEFEIFNVAFLIYHPGPAEFQMDRQILAEISFGGEKQFLREAKLKHLSEVLPEMMLRALKEAK